MSHNPTYQNDMDTSGNNLDLEEKRPEYYPSQPAMASYRAATTDPSAPAYQPGRSYRHATDDIPEDADEADGYTPHDEARRVDFTTPSNGGMSRKSQNSSSSSGRMLLYIVGALAVLFFILALIFIILYATKSTDPTTPSNVSPQSINTTVTVETTSPKTTIGTTQKPADLTLIGNHKLWTLREGDVEVELFSLGARVNAFKIGNKDIVAGFNITAANVNTLRDYAYGAANGRVCSAIESYTLAREGSQGSSGSVDNVDTSGKNTKKGLYALDFESESEADGSITFTKTVTQNDDDVPGSAKIEINYKLNANRSLTVTRTAESTGNSLIDLCNSMRFNLNGNGNSVLDTQLMVNANYLITPQYDTNAFSDPYDTYDFFTAKPLQNIVDVVQSGGRNNRDFNAFYYINQVQPVPGGLSKAVELSIVNGIKLEVWTSNKIAKIFVPAAANTPTIPGKFSYGQSSYVSVVTHNYPNGPALSGWQATMWFPRGAKYQSVDQYKITEVGQ